MSKDKQYEKVAKELLKYVGGEENIISVAHCATRLRVVLKDDKKIESEAIEEIDLVKGSFIMVVNFK